MDAALTAGDATPAEQASAASMAAEAVRLASVDSHRALILAQRARVQLARGADPSAGPLVERALGIVATQCGRMPEAVRHLRRSVAMAERTGLPMLAAEVRVDLSEALVLHGRPDRALEEVERARSILRGAAAGRPLMRSALIQQRRGQHQQALEGYRRALACLRRAGDREWEARLLCNRGVLHAFRGEFAAAEADLGRAAALHAELGGELAVANVHHNLAFVAAQRGDVPTALALYDATDREYHRLGSDRGILQLDRCAVLLSVDLVAEALEAGQQAVAELERSHLDADLPEARLTLAHAALLHGKPAAARDQADRARVEFSRQGRGAWAALARYWSLRARWMAGDRKPALLVAARRASTELRAAGWAAEALDARLIAGRVAIELGDRETASQELSLASAARRRGPVRLRLGAWHAEGLLRQSTGNLRGAESAVAAGLRVAEAHRAALGATELRAQASAQAAELAGLGVRLALDSGAPRRVLMAAERCRASALNLKAARPPRDPVLARELAELRRIAGELRSTVLNGASSGALLRRQVELEAAIRRRSRHARGASNLSHVSLPTLDVLAQRLGDNVLLEYIESDRRLFAVTMRDGRTRLWHLGPVTGPAGELPTLAFSLRRLALRRGSEATLRAHARTADEAARRLDAILMAPLRRELEDRPLTIVPTGALHSTDWPALPTCAGRPLTVAPSAALWYGCATSPGPTGEGSGRTLLVAGPGLRDAEAEVLDLRGQYGDAVCLTRERATVEAVTRALATADVAHIAAHGSFRTDNALFSALELDDGPLTVFDIEALGGAPQRLILSACDSGLTSVASRDALIGLSSALFTLGTKTIIGSVVPVRDDQTRELMVSLHKRLRAGASPAAALAECQGRLAADSPAAFAGAAAFVCYGAG